MCCHRAKGNIYNVDNAANLMLEYMQTAHDFKLPNAASQMKRTFYANKVNDIKAKNVVTDIWLVHQIRNKACHYMAAFLNTLPYCFFDATANPPREDDREGCAPSAYLRLGDDNSHSFDDEFPDREIAAR